MTGWRKIGGGDKILASSQRNESEKGNQFLTTSIANIYYSTQGSRSDKVLYERRQNTRYIIPLLFPPTFLHLSYINHTISPCPSSREIDILSRYNTVSRQ